MAKPFDTQTVSKIYRESLQDAVARYEEMVRGLSILRRLNESLQLGADFNEICQELVKLISEEIFPLLLNKDKEYLDTHGTPIELMTAFWQALTYHAPTIFGTSAWEGLKKLASEEEEKAEEPQTPSE